MSKLMTDDQFQTIINWLVSGHHAPTQIQVTAIMRMLDEFERLQAENAALREIAEVVVDNGYKALQGHAFDCWYCGNQPFRQFPPGSTLIGGWEHAPDCPVTKARALLAAGESEDGE